MKPNRLLAIVGSTIIAISAGGLAAGALSDSGPKSQRPAILAEVSGATGETGVDASTTTIPRPTSTTFDDNVSDDDSDSICGDSSDYSGNSGNSGSDTPCIDEPDDSDLRSEDGDDSSHESDDDSDDDSGDDSSHESDDNSGHDSGDNSDD